jgi:tetratricopeptide (TPR) repeat protein
VKRARERKRLRTPSYGILAALVLSSLVLCFFQGALITKRERGNARPSKVRSQVNVKQALFEGRSLMEKGEFGRILPLVKDTFERGGDIGALVSLPIGLVMTHCRPREAIPVFQYMIEHGDTLPDMYAYLGNAHWELFDQDKAIETVRAGLRKFPKHQELNSDLVFYLMYRGKFPSMDPKIRRASWEEAESRLRILEERGFPVEDLRMLAHLYRGEYPRALEAARKIIMNEAHYPHQTEHIQAGVCGAILCLIEGRKKEASSFLFEARRGIARLKPDTPDVFSPVVGNGDLIGIIFLNEKIPRGYVTARDEKKERWEKKSRALRMTDALEWEGVNAFVRARERGDPKEEEKSLKKLIEIPRNYPGSCNFSLALISPFLTSTYQILLSNLLKKQGRAAEAGQYRSAAEHVFPRNPLLKVSPGRR